MCALPAVPESLLNVMLQSCQLNKLLTLVTACRRPVRNDGHVLDPPKSRPVGPFHKLKVPNIMQSCMLANTDALPRLSAEI